MKIRLMRGLPGCGKSTWIKDHLPANVHVCSADYYHIIDGVYDFRIENAGKAHNSCYRDFAFKVLNQIGERDIVADNTNTSVLELSPYVRIAQAFDINYEIIYLHCDLEKAFLRNIHNVPITTMMAMQTNLLTEKLPFGWQQTIKFVK